MVAIFGDDFTMVARLVFNTLHPCLRLMKITAVQIDPPKLHKTIVTHFGLDEIRTLCFDLTLDFDELPPGGKSAKARGLVEMCQRQRRLVALAEAILEHFAPIFPNAQFLRDIANDDAPFKGLLAFEEADEEIFFGREDLTAELVARVLPTSRRFLPAVKSIDKPAGGFEPQ